jgi:two-component SAPR family response regulator
MTALAGLRVLVVEDELMVAIMIEQALRRADCVLVGPVPRIAKAIEMARSEPIDVALLDVNLAGERVFPVADVLIERAVPFVFLTGYASGVVPSAYANRNILGKPFTPATLYRTLEAAIAG